MDIFISYSSKDIDIVKKVCDGFKANDFEYWVAHENGEFGGHYAATIVEEIGKCKVFVVFISNSTSL